MNSVDHAIYSEDAKCFISSRIQRLGEILQDYDQNLELRWVPPGARSDIDNSRPYCIVDTGREKPYVVMYFGEDVQPEEVLARVFEGDNQQHNVLEKIQIREAANKAFRLKEQMDAAEESADMVHFLMTSRSKNYVMWKDRTTGETVKLNESRRREGPRKTHIW